MTLVMNVMTMDQFLTVLKALSDETRLRLVHLLLTGDFCGRALACRLGISEAAVSQHLKILKEAGLLDGEKRGYWTHYSVQRDVLEEVTGELNRMARQSTIPNRHCHRLLAQKGRSLTGKEAKIMCCGPCCEQPDKLKGKPEECTPRQIAECHGNTKKHPCTPPAFPGEANAGNRLVKIQVHKRRTK
jgi:DNA-binding transcriptional ArsR family regulator